MQFALPASIVPGVISVLVEGCSVPKLVFSYVGPEASKARVVVKLVPRYRVLLTSEAKNVSKAITE